MQEPYPAGYRVGGDLSLPFRLQYQLKQWSPTVSPQRDIRVLPAEHRTYSYIKHSSQLAINAEALKCPDTQQLNVSLKEKKEENFSMYHCKGKTHTKKILSLTW